LEILLHRIIKKYENKFIAKGDSNNCEDEIQENSKIIGKVEFHSLVIGRFITKYLKYVIIFFIICIIFNNIYFLRK
jgi:hypothetical protein